MSYLTERKLLKVFERALKVREILQNSHGWYFLFICFHLFLRHQRDGISLLGIDKENVIFNNDSKIVHMKTITFSVSTSSNHQYAVIWEKSVIYTASPPPRKAGARRPPPEKFGMLQRYIEWQKSWKMGEKIGKKINFHCDFCMQILKFSQKFLILNGFSSKTRKNLQLGFLISFWIIKDFQKSIKFALIFIKISFFKSKFAKYLWKFSKFCRFPLIFRLIF